MDKKGKIFELFSVLQKYWKTFKQSYLYKLVSKFLSTICSIILVILLIIGGLMFYFNMKIKSYESRGMEFTAPFGLYTIISGSMEPNVDIYDVVIAVEHDIDKIKIGDIITFISTWDLNYGVTVTHRVVGISKTTTGEILLTTKGDNNQQPDGAKVTQSNLVGKVVGRLPQLGRLQFFLATKMGWFLIVFIPAMIIIIVDVMKIFKLYVLKNKIDNVKTPKEAKMEKVVRELEKKPKEIKELNNQPIVNRVPKDENIDTVELPKVGEDGIIKENTSELPQVKVNNKIDIGRVDEINILSAAWDLREEYDTGIPVLKKDDSLPQMKDESDIPLLKSEESFDDGGEDDGLPQRKELRRRN